MNLGRPIRAVALVGVGYLLYRAVSTATRGLPLPVGSWRLSSPFGDRTNPVTGSPQHHDGVDLAAAIDTPIYAVAPGVVEVSKDGHPTNGNYVSVRTKGGDLWSYLHMSSRGVSVGEKVSQGDTLGWVGSTGRSTGPHLHLQFENQAGKLKDPVSLIPRLRSGSIG